MPKPTNLSKALIILLLAITHETFAQVPVVNKSGEDLPLCLGKETSISITATNNPTSYRWQVLINQKTGDKWDDITDDSVYDGSKSVTLTIKTAYFRLDASGNYPHAYRCIASNSFGQSDIESWDAVYYLYITTALPPPPKRFTRQTSTICAGTNDVIYSMYSTGSLNTGNNWTYTGQNATIVNYVRWDTAIKINFTDSATSGILSVAQVNACGVGAPITIPITVNPLQPTPAGSPGSASCSHYTIGNGATTYTDPATCSPITALNPSGSSPVTGDITNCVTIDAAVQSYNGIPYVQRRYNIEPAANASTSTATLTLYYTQSDFDNYNTARGSNPALPTGPTDAAGIANLRITQFHGSGTTPGTYAGGSGEIDPDDSKIVWTATASRWEVTFDIVGFSGFFVSGSSLITPLPLTLTAFSGRTNTNGNLLRWTTASEENTATFEIQRSDNASGAGNYHTIATLPAAGNSRQSIDYTYTDANVPQSASVSYRLRMTDLDGSFTFSRILTLHPGQTSLGLRILPNPSAVPQYIAAHATQTGNATLTVTDLSGKLIIRKNIVLQAGDNSIEASSLHTLQRGFYLLTLDTDAQKQTIKFIKE